MANIDRRCTNAAKSAFPRAQAKIGILQIARIKVFGQRANGIETCAGQVEAKADSARDVDDSIRVDLRRNCVDPIYILARWQWVEPVGDWKACKLSVVR